VRLTEKHVKSPNSKNASEPDSTSETIYDHPLYYDILFGWDRTQEADFYESVFEHYGITKQDALLEVACGTGQVGRVLATRGWQFTGLDSRESMLAFLSEQVRLQGVAARTLCADMVDFSCELPLGAAFNPLSSLLLLSDDASVQAHFAKMATALRTNGVYVLDLGFNTEVRPDAQTTDEIWEESRGNITVRAENDAVYVDHAGGRHVLPWGHGSHLRAVTSRWLEDRVEPYGQFAIESWHPESGRTAAGVSQWNLDVRTEPPVFVRAMVVLRRL
jgi:SAM-dependent methyltransferase